MGLKDDYTNPDWDIFLVKEGKTPAEDIINMGNFYGTKKEFNDMMKKFASWSKKDKTSTESDSGDSTGGEK